MLRTYWLYVGGAACVFFNSVFFVFYSQVLGLSVAEILALQSYATALRGALDVPLGGVADRVSRRGCLLWSSVCLASGPAVLLLFPSLAAAIVAETLIATSTALRSGADSALLFDALEAEGRREQYAFAESRAQAFASIGSASAAVLGGLLAAADLRLPYLVSTVFAVGTGLVAYRLPDARPAASVRRSTRPLREAVSGVASSPSLLWVVGLYVLVVVVSHVYYYLQQPFLEEVGMPVAVFGLVFAGTKLVTALVANVAHRVDGALGERGTSALMTVVGAGGLGAMALASGPWGALFILSRGLLDGLWMPLANIYTNRRVASALRATTLSLQSVAGRFVLAAVLALLGGAMETTALAPLLAVSAVATAVLGLALVLARPRGV